MANILAITALQIINEAMGLINEKEVGQPLAQEDVDDCLVSLNYMVKMWQAQGLHLWTESEAILPLTVGQTEYKIGRGTGCDDAFGLDDGIVNTTLTAPESVTDTSINLSSISGVTYAENILAVDPTTDASLWTVNTGTIDDSGGFLTITQPTVGVVANIEIVMTGMIVNNKYTIKAEGIGFEGSNPNGSLSVTSAGNISGDVAFNNLGETETLNQFTAVQETLTLTLQTEIGAGGTAPSDFTIQTIKLFNRDTGSELRIELDSGSVSANTALENTSGNNVSISPGLTGDAAAGNIVVGYGPRINRPVNILALRRSNLLDSKQDISAVKWSRQQYFAQPNKSSQGTVNNWYYSPQLTCGRLHLWQPASSDIQAVKFTFIRPIEINTDTANSPDFPSEWFLPLAYGLALYIGPEYRQPQGRLEQIRALFDEMMDDVLGHDQEKSSLNIRPNFGF